MLATGVARRLDHDAAHLLNHYDVLETQVMHMCAFYMYITSKLLFHFDWPAIVNTDCVLQTAHEFYLYCFLLLVELHCRRSNGQQTRQPMAAHCVDTHA
eukprot:11147-Heterococcus_DN1.PRE.2